MICKQCKKEFKKSYPKEERTFCGFKCYWESLKKQMPKKPIKIRPPVFINCELCNFSFKRKSKSTRFCSIACRGKYEYKIHYKNINCVICNKEFTVKTYNSRKTCSKECMFISHRGSNNGSWKGGIIKDKDRRKSLSMVNWRKAVFERDDYTCQKCKVRGSLLFPHHIFFYAQFIELRDNLDNGITLCDLCHKFTHKIIPRNHLITMSNGEKEDIIKNNKYKEWLFSFYNSLG